jgi:adenosylcobinamide-phosphate synthase
MISSKALLIYLAGTTIALRELVASAKRVIASAEDGILNDARKHLSMIVGRDTEGLSDQGVFRATVETLAENLSDGVIAPVFYLVLGGLPMAIAYKAVNTLDSMVGYKNEKYIRFGWAAAKLDDVANYIPARLSGLLIVLAAFLISLFRETFHSLSLAHRSLRIMLRDGRNHTSPNSGVPEAAMAGALGVRLGGPSTYGGMTVEKPYIGDERNSDYLQASKKAMALVSLASVLSVTAAALVLSLRMRP